MSKKIIAAFLAAAMLATTLPLNTFAQEPATPENAALLEVPTVMEEAPYGEESAGEAVREAPVEEEVAEDAAQEATEEAAQEATEATADTLPTYAAAGNAGTYGDLTYTVNEDGTTCTITDCNDTASGEMVIPEKIDELQVISIGNSAFYECRDLTNITIPEGVTSIGNSAFEASGLTSIALPERLKHIGSYAFRYCNNLTNITIPSSETSFGFAPFTDCNSLITAGPIGSGSNYEFGWTGAIPGSAFHGCSSLTKAIIPESVTRIGDSAFHGCISLTDITIPSGVTLIDSFAFANCSSLANITIPEGVTSIRDSAFAGCSGLTNIEVPESVTTIGDYAFENCTNVTSITLPKGITNIGEYTFSHCSSLKSITIPENVTSIGEYAFYYCSSLANIKIPNSVTRIEDNAFNACFGLTDVYYSGNETQWKAITINFCNDSLTNATIHYNSTGPAAGDKGTYWGTGTYKDLTYGVNLDSKTCTITDCNETASGELDIPAEIDGYRVTGIGERAFSECDNLTSITIPDSVTSIGNYAFYLCSGLTSIAIPTGVTNIDWDAFSNCSSLTSITIPDGITNIEEETFYNCSSLASITIPDSVTTIERFAFDNCRSLTSITIPDSVTTIGNGAFNDCDSLASITIPASVTNIESVPFAHCDSLTNIGVNEKNDVYRSQQGILFNKTGTRLICYPAGISGDYTIPSSVTSIDVGAFSSCYNLTSITIPNSVTSIGNGAFFACWGLTNIAIPDSITSIKSHTFSTCTSLTSVTIPDSVTSIEDRAFVSCSSLTSITIPDGVTSIGNAAFDGCSNLTSISIPNSVTSIGDFTFSNGNGRLTDVYYSGSETQWKAISIGSHNDDLTNATIHYNSPAPGEPTAIELDVDIYRANQLLEPEVYPHAYYPLDDIARKTPSQLYAEALNSSAGFVAAKNSWKGVTTTVDLLEGGVTATAKLVVEKKDIYAALILASLQSVTGKSSLESAEENGKEAVECVKKAVDAVNDLYGINLYVADQYKGMTEDQTKTLENLLSKELKSQMAESPKFSEVMQGTLKDLKALMKVAATSADFADMLYNNLYLAALSINQKELIAAMYEQCPDSNKDLKAALWECKTITEAAYEDVVDGTLIYGTGKVAFETAMDACWEIVTKEMEAACPIVKALSLGYKNGRNASNLLFKTDSIVEGYYKIAAMVEMEKVFVDTYMTLQSQYVDEKTTKNAQLYLAMTDLLYGMWQVDCKQAYNFVDSLDSAAVTRISKALADILGNDSSAAGSYEKIKEQLNRIQRAYEASHESLVSVWVEYLPEDYPGSGLYEQYAPIAYKKLMERIKKMKVACPVDVAVYDQEGTVVASVVDERIYSQGSLSITLDGEEKTIAFYDDGEYDVKINGYDAGTMDITVTEYNNDKDVIRNVYYTDVSVNSSSGHTVHTDGNTLGGIYYKLTDQNNAVVTEKLDTYNPRSQTSYEVTVENGIAQTGNESGTAVRAYPGQTVQILAMPLSDQQLIRWEYDSSCITLDDPQAVAASFIMPSQNVNLCAALTQSASVVPTPTPTTKPTATPTKKPGTNPTATPTRKPTATATPKPGGKNGWYTENGKQVWYENGVKQGTTGRGKEIYDPKSDAWYWLDAVQGGAKAVSKDVYQESLAGPWGDRVNADGERVGKWVRYDENGHMVKGWQTTDAGKYYFDTTYGTMAKGFATVEGREYYFDPTSGVLQYEVGPVPANGWKTIDGKDYWYEDGDRQGDSVDASYRGKEIYDPASNAWYWMDNVQGGAKAVSKDVYQESLAGPWGDKVNAKGERVGKWVRYDENGHMVKGWQTTEAGTYYFDPIYGTMAKGEAVIDGQTYYFDPASGIRK